MSQFSISAKNLGELALGDACPKCFWLKLRVSHKLPFQIFPGIFSSIDSYTKRIIDSFFTTSGVPPNWLPDLQNATRSLPTPGFRKFRALMEESDIVLTGALDALFETSDGTLCVVDYKTARFTGSQDHLLPMYLVQLNGYAVIAEKLGMGRVRKLLLVYFEPRTDDADVMDTRNSRQDGFGLSFSAHCHTLELNPDSWLHPQLRLARALYDSSRPPEGRAGCDNCLKLDMLIKQLDQLG